MIYGTGDEAEKVWILFYIILTLLKMLRKLLLLRVKPVSFLPKLFLPFSTKPGSSHSFEVTLSREEWLKRLTHKEFDILRNKGTERPFRGEYNQFLPNKGYFACRGCENPLYSYKSKYESNCGWPAFDKCYEDSILTEVDTSFGMKRVEILCKKCGGHLGHIFTDGHGRTKERHCVNSLSIIYKQEDYNDKDETTLGV